MRLKFFNPILRINCCIIFGVLVFTSGCGDRNINKDKSLPDTGERQNQQPAPPQLIKALVEVTGIEVLPDHLDYIVSSPKKQLQQIIEEGYATKTKILNTVRYNGFFLSYWKPLDYPGNHRRGDVICTFLLDSIKEKEAFLSEHKLQVHAAREGHDSFQYTEYASRQDYYVILQTKTTKYTCNKHPAVIEDEKGKCKKCGTELENTHIFQ